VDIQGSEMNRLRWMLIVLLVGSNSSMLVAAGRKNMSSLASLYNSGTNQQVLDRVTKGNLEQQPDGSWVMRPRTGLNAMQDKVSWSNLANVETRDLGIVRAPKEFDIVFPEPGRKIMYTFIPTERPLLNNKKIEFLMVTLGFDNGLKNMPKSTAKTLMDLRRKNEDLKGVITVYRRMRGESQWTEAYRESFDAMVNFDERIRALITPDARLVLGKCMKEPPKGDVLGGGCAIAPIIIDLGHME
jgi:hypothetical protein